MSLKLTILTSLSALAVSSLSAVTLNIPSHGGDQEIYSTGGAKWVGQAEMRVGGSGTDVDAAAVFFFALPELGENDVISDAIFTVGLDMKSNSPTFNLDLYGLGYRSSAAANPIEDFFSGAFETDPTATGLQSAFMTPAALASDIISTSSAGSANLASFLSSLYAGGAVAGDYAVLRLNADIANPSNYHYYNIPSASYADTGMRPTLTITTVPEPSTTAALFGAAAFGLVALRRRLKR